jgi:hypothetical protein
MYFTIMQMKNIRDEAVKDRKIFGIDEVIRSSETELEPMNIAKILGV